VWRDRTHHDGAVVRPAVARLGGQWATDLLEVSSDPAVLDGSGRWAVAIPYSGSPVLARFAQWTEDTDPDAHHAASAARWVGPATDAWATSMDRTAYCDGVQSLRAAIAAGDVYQANLCRVLSAALPDPDADDVAGLWRLLDRGNPAPFGGFLRLPEQDVAIVSASPELFLRVRDASGGRVVTSGPIKGTGRTAEDLTDKDVAENVMIVDLVRNDLSRVSVPGTVTVPDLLEVQEHPGLVHLVSTVQGVLVPETTWSDLLDATFPPGSVTGAPKLAALAMIEEREPAEREFYCGAFGWVDADTGEAELAVAIRTFWLRAGVLHFGTGAGITWGSDAEAEWRETELKAARLIEVASGTWPAAWQGGAP